MIKNIQHTQSIRVLKNDTVERLVKRSYTSKSMGRSTEMEINRGTV
jgi:hypothetical protein